MSKHTPGKWNYYPKLSGTENHRGFRIYASEVDGWALADVQPGDIDGDEGEANARLIAAAPTMLEALRVSVVAFEGDPLDVIELAYGLAAANRISVARAAIKAATGETE